MKALELGDSGAGSYGPATVNVHEAKTHLSRLLEQVAAGQSFVIARAGRPVARLLPLESAAVTTPRKLGFLQGEIQVPEDFDQWQGDAVTALFEGKM